MQDILYILENEEKRKDFILRLKQAGEMSEEVQAITNVMSSLHLLEKYQTTILRHTFEFCDGMEAFQNFRLVSKSWKLAVETTKFDTWRLLGLNDILVQIVEKFGQGKYPLIYHKLLQNLKPNHSYFDFTGTLLSNNFNPITKLVCKNMKGLKTIYIKYDSDVIGDEIYENFLTEFLPNSKNTLCDLQVPIWFLPNIYFPNLTKLTVHDLALPLEIFKSQFAQILKNMPDLKIIHIPFTTYPPITQIICDYLISNYAEQCLLLFFSFEFGSNTQFPFKIICHSEFRELVDFCQFKSSLNYVQFWISATNPDEADWNYFKENIYDFSNLKGINFLGVLNFPGAGIFFNESDFYKPETNNVDPELETFYNVWPNRIQFLKSRGIQILNEKEFESIKAERSNNLKWAFHFGD